MVVKSVSSPDVNGSGRQRLSYGWIIAIASLLICFITMGIRLSFGVFFTPLETDFGWTRATTSSVFSAYMILCAVFGFAGGWASDRYSTKLVVLIMGLFTGLSLLLTSYASELWHFFLTYSLLLAIGTGPAFTIALSTAIRWFTKRRGLAVGIVTSGQDLGVLVMAPFAAWLIAASDWRNSFLVISGMAILVMIPCALVMRRSPGQEFNVKAPPSTEVKSATKDQTSLQIIKSRNLWLMFSIWVFNASCAFIISTHLIRHAIDLNIDPIKAAIVFSITGGTSIPGRIIIGRMSDYLGRKQVGIVSTLVAAASMLWFTRASELWEFYVFAAAFGFSTGGLNSAVNAYIGDLFSARHIGFTVGILNIGWAAGAAVGPTVAGFIFDSTSSYTMAFLAGALALILIVVSILLTRAKSAGMAEEPGLTLKQPLRS